MALLAHNMDLTDKNFDSLRARLQNLVRSVFPDWTDFSVAGFGNILLEMYAFVGDVLTFYQDAQARESRLVTTTQRRNIIALAKLIGYKLPGASAATADMEFTLAAMPAADVTIPKGTVVRTQEVTEPVRFQLLSDVTIPAGADPPKVTGRVENSTSREQLFGSTGLANQEIMLDFTPYLDGSVQITAGNGGYEEVEDFLDSTSNDRHFVIIVDQNDRATIRFGNGVNGAVPTGTIRVSYKTGGGRKGIVDADRIVVIEGSFTDAHGNPVRVSVRNPEPSSGGEDRQSVAQAKILAPASIRTLNRTVSREDYEVNALRLPGVARALMLTSNEKATIDENSGILYVIPSGGGMPSSELKDQVFHQVTEVFPNTLTFQVSVQNPVYRTIDVQAKIFLRQGYQGSAVKTAVDKALAEYFAVSLPDETPNPNVDFGFNIKDADGNPVGEIAWSDVFNVVRDAAGVRKVSREPDGFLLNGEEDDVVLDIEEFPVLGTATLVDGDSGHEL